MSDDDSEPETILPTLLPLSLTGVDSPFSTQDEDTFPTFPSQTSTGSSSSTSSSSTDTSLSLTITQTNDPTATDAFPSDTGTPDTITATPEDPSTLTLTVPDASTPLTQPTDPGTVGSVFASNSLDSITIDPSAPSSLADPSTDSDTLITIITPTFTGATPPTFPPTSPMTTPDPTSTTNDPTSITSSPILSSSLTSSSVQSSSSSLLFTTKYPPTVTTVAFPTFTAIVPPVRSSNRTGLIVAATTGAIAFAIALGLLMRACKKRHRRGARRRTTLDPFVDLDNEMVTVNQPLIIGDGPGPGGVVYTDPFTDDSRPITQSRNVSLTTGLGTGVEGSNNSSRAVVGTGSTPTPDPGGGPVPGYYDQHRQTDRLLASSQYPPLLPPPPPPEITRSRSPQSLPQVQTQFPPEFPAPQRLSPTFDAGAVAFLRDAGQTADHSPPSPGYYSPGNAEERLTSAFSVTSELSPQYSTHPRSLNIDDMLRSSPDPVQASSAYRDPFDRRHSFTPSLSVPVYDSEDIVVTIPLDPPAQDPTQGLPSPGSEYTASPATIRGGDMSSRPSPISEVVQMLQQAGYPQDGSNDSFTQISTDSMDTTRSSPVVMTAERVQVSPGPMSLPLRSPSYTMVRELALAAKRTEEALPPTGATDQFAQLQPPPGGSPPMPPLPQVQPLSLGKKRSAQGPI